MTLAEGAAVLKSRPSVCTQPPVMDGHCAVSGRAPSALDLSPIAPPLLSHPHQSPLVEQIAVLEWEEWRRGAQGLLWGERRAVSGRLRLEMVKGGKMGLSRRWSLGLTTRWDPKPTRLGLGVPCGQRAFLPQNANLPPQSCLTLHIAPSLHPSVSPLRHDANESWRRKEAAVFVRLRAKETTPKPQSGSLGLLKIDAVHKCGLMWRELCKTQRGTRFTGLWQTLLPQFRPP